MVAADACVLRVRCRHSLHPHPSAPSSHALSCKPSRQHFCRLSSLSSSAPVSSSLGRSFSFLTLCAWHPSRPRGAPVQPVRAPGGNLERGRQSLLPATVLCSGRGSWWSRPAAQLPPTGLPLRCSRRGPWRASWQVGETSIDGSDAGAVTPDATRAISVC